MAIIHNDGSRPVVRVTGGGSTGAGAPFDAATLAWLHAAAAAVARVEIAGTLAPFIGTAFAVAPRLAVTSLQVADIIIAAHHAAPANPLAWVDFADSPNPGSPKCAVVAVHRVHPYWQFAFLALAADAPHTLEVALPPAPRIEALVNRAICVIGYPTRDMRNDEAAIDSLFGDLPPEKYLMPGCTGAIATIEPENSRVVRHDASTLGGVSGAPIFDIGSGAVIAIHLTGTFGETNIAAPAWELLRDPQWAQLPVIGVSPSPPPPQLDTDASDELIDHATLLALSDLLVTMGFESMDDIDTLLTGLPPKLRAMLPQKENPFNTLLACLAALNRVTVRYGDMLPLDQLLSTAQTLRSLQIGPVARIAAIRVMIAGHG